MEKTSEIYDLLVRVKNGYDPGWSDLSKYDDLLYDIDFNYRNNGLSSVNILFNNYDDFFNLFEDLNDEDKMYLNDYLSDYQPNNEYYENDDWDEGHITGHLNDENNNEINKIYNLISKPEGTEPISESDARRYIREQFPDEISSIMGEFSELYHQCRIRSIQNDLFDEFGNLFYPFGIREIIPLYKYKCSVNILLKLFAIVGDRSQNLTELFSSILEKVDRKSHGWYGEVYYETICEDFDYGSFNKDSKYYLDKIFEKLNGSEEYSNFEEYVELKHRLSTEYKFNKWIPIERNPNLFFMIRDIDRKTHKIIITFRNNESDNREETRSVTYDELKRLQSQYELFNERRKIIKKVLRSI